MKNTVNTWSTLLSFYFGEKKETIEKRLKPLLLLDNQDLTNTKYIIYKNKKVKVRRKWEEKLT